MPRELLTLAEGEHTVWGIDVGVHRCDVAAIARDGRFTWNAIALAYEESETHHGHKAAAALAQTRRFFSVYAGHFPPALIYVEWPIGGARNIPLATMAAILVAVCGDLAPTYRANSSIWKSQLGLPGNIGKKAGADYPALRWARERGLPSSEGHNAADALAIATTAAEDLDGWVAPPVL